jgi:hypothetical protein
MGRRQIERGLEAEGGPFAYVLDPTASHDPSSVVEFMDLMSLSGIEFLLASDSFTAGGRSFPAGSYVIPPQAFRPYVVDLMEPKRYPDRRQFPGGPPEPPYDMTGYELRFQMALEVANVDERFDMPGGDWGAVRTDVGHVRGEGAAGFVVSATSNWLYRALAELRDPDSPLFRITRAVPGTQGDLGAGSFWLPGLSGATARSMADDYGLTLTGLETAPDPESLAAVRPPRIAIYRSYRAAMPEGWTRWVLDQYGLEWENVWDADVRAGELARFDVVILPSQSASDIASGHDPAVMPAEFAGGLGREGAAALRAFVAGGGRVIAFDQSVDYAIDAFGLPFRNTAGELPTREFFIPGSIIRLEVDPTHPLAYGMSTDAMTLFARSQVLERTGGGEGVSTPVCYAGSEYLVSGWTLGGDEILAGRTAVAQVEVGRGDVVLFAFTPHFRGQPRNTFKLLFNALVGSATDGLPRRPGLECA